jgi:hypothetical protein
MDGAGRVIEGLAELPALRISDQSIERLIFG